MECGQHDDPNATRIAEQAIMNVLGHHGAIDYKPQRIGSGLKTATYSIQKIFCNDAVQGYEGSIPAHMQSYREGQTIAHLLNGQTITAPVNDTRVLFPNNGTKDGQAPGAEQFSYAIPLAPENK